MRETQTDWWFHLGMFLGEASKIDERWLRDKLIELHQYAHRWDHLTCYEIIKDVEQKRVIRSESETGILLHNLITKYRSTFGN